ncbi:hypothetical protein [Sphingomonas abietis]|uniref:Uncharacterized protein n=1 Tax=Sphingomonas abietis TaxID=3012344 RepID=A0ABY7NIL0_9SPHN|nr:hypothetical protein [Sphingomonas abietis]WBO21323.1 hypothetical protein PBT88_14160 [Sphingomonas abietis]
MFINVSRERARSAARGWAVAGWPVVDASVTVDGYREGLLGRRDGEGGRPRKSQSLSRGHEETGNAIESQRRHSWDQP